MPPSHTPRPLTEAAIAGGHFPRSAEAEARKALEATYPIRPTDLSPAHFPSPARPGPETASSSRILEAAQAMRTAEAEARKTYQIAQAQRSAAMAAEHQRMSDIQKALEMGRKEAAAAAAATGIHNQQAAPPNAGTTKGDILIHEADPQSRPVVITIFTLVTFQNLTKQNKFSSQTSDRYWRLVLAKWNMDDTHDIFLLFLLL